MAEPVPPEGARPHSLSAQRKLLQIFAVQLVAVAAIWSAGLWAGAGVGLLLSLSAVAIMLGWFAASRMWRPLHKLALQVQSWGSSKQPKLDALPAHADEDLVTLVDGLRDFTQKVAGYSERERNFTRDASHELRSPLTVIKMSSDMLLGEPSISEFGQRSIQRIRRATRDMEALVEAMLTLAREAEQGHDECDFAVNDVLRSELADISDMVYGQPKKLRLQESGRFSLHGAPRVFAVLCRQLIRQAGQQELQPASGVQIAILSDKAIRITATVDPERGDENGGIQPMQGLDYAIAQRITERFGWPMEVTVEEGRFVALVRFPQGFFDSADHAFRMPHSGGATRR